MSRGFVLWFTGLSGSGKSTLTAMVAAELRQRGVHVETLDGDEIRKHLSKGLGFSREDRDANIRRIGFVAKLVARSGGCAIAAAISPYREIRNEIRRSIDRFCEVYTECPLDVLAERDPKGLYKRALAGEIKNFTGVDDPYQAPDSPEVHLRTDAETPAESLAKILERLEALGFIPREGGASARAMQADAPPELVLPHGGDLVDRWLRGDRAAQASEQAKSLPSLELDAGEALDLMSIATGAYSPLKGFVGQKDYLRVLRGLRLETGHPWPLAVTLAFDEELETSIRNAAEVALRTRGGDLVGLLSVADVWRPDKEREAQLAFGTTDPSHPGVRRLSQRGPVYVGGEIRCLEGARAATTATQIIARPLQLRREMRRLGWQNVVAVPSGDLPRRSAEHLARAALELADGLVFQPLVTADAGPNEGREAREQPELANAPLPAALRIQSYELVAERYFAPGRVLIAPVGRGSGGSPLRLAVLHALVAKNYGASRALFFESAGLTGEDLRRAFGVAELGITVHVLPAARFSETLGELATSRTAPAPFGTTSAEAADELRPEVAALVNQQGEG